MSGVGMADECYYIFIKTAESQNQKEEFDKESMKEFLIEMARARAEGELYHSKLPRIKILYNFDNGEVKIVGKEADINSEYTRAFQEQRKQVEEAIRRFAKLELLMELYKWSDKHVCDLIKKNPGYDAATGQIHKKTSEVELDMTLVQIIKLGYPRPGIRFLKIFIFADSNIKYQTHLHKAIYNAFEDFNKMFSSGSRSYGLENLKSRMAVEQFKNLIAQHLNHGKLQSTDFKKSF